MITSLRYICPPGTGTLRMLLLMMTFMPSSSAVSVSFLVGIRSMALRSLTSFCFHYILELDL